MLWGIDTATRSTGITAGDGSKKPAVGAWTFDHCGNDIGQLLFEFDSRMDELAARLGAPTAVIFEAPILTRYDTLLPLRKLYGMAANVELWCKRRGIVCQEESAKGLKKALTGDAFAKKPQMVAACRRLGLTLPGDKTAEDAADSFAAWYVGVRHHAPAHIAAWDQAIYSRRGYVL